MFFMIMTMKRAWIIGKWIAAAAVLLAIGAFAGPRLLGLSYQVRGGSLLDQVTHAGEGEGVLFACMQEPVINPEQAGQLERVVSDLEKAVKLDASLAQAHLLLGRAGCLVGDYQAAVASFQEYTRLRPQNPLGHLELAFAYAAAHDPTESPYALLAQAPGSLAAWKLPERMALAVAEWQAGGSGAAVFRAQGDRAVQADEDAAALAWYEYALWVQIDAADTWLAVGNVKQASGEAAQALQAYRLAWNCDAALATETYAAALEEQGSLPEAEEVLRQALETQPQAAERLLWWTRLGRLMAEQERWVDAQEGYRSALAEYPAESRFFIGLGWALYEGEQGAQAALDAFEQATLLAPNSAEGYYAAGLLLVQEGRYAEAADDYAEAVARAPGEKWYRLVRANALRSAGNLPEALAVYEETVGLFPGYAQAYYDMAWAYHLAGNPAQAQAAIQQALSLMARPDAWYYMRAGGIFEAAGEIDAAVAYYQQALAIDASINAAQQALERLNQP